MIINKRLKDARLAKDITDEEYKAQIRAGKKPTDLVRLDIKEAKKG